MKGFTLQRILLMLLVTIVPIMALLSEFWLVSLDVIGASFVIIGVLAIIFNNFSVLIWHRWRKPFPFRLKDATFVSIAISVVTLLVLVHIFGPYSKQRVEYASVYGILIWFWLLLFIIFCAKFKQWAKAIGGCILTCAILFIFFNVASSCLQIIHYICPISFALDMIVACGLVGSFGVLIICLAIMLCRRLLFKRK